MQRAAKILLGALVGLVACRDSGDLNEAKLQPKLPPPAGVTIPTDMRIEIAIAGQQIGLLDAATLNARPPDFRDATHRAWRIMALVGSAGDREGAVISVQGEEGVTITMERPASDTDLQPVLMLTRRGEIVAALVSPADPFPPYHGQGRRLSRGGDKLPRLGGVKRIAISFQTPSGRD